MEIIGSNYFCNLSEIHLNRLDPLDLKSQEEAFEVGALNVAILLNHEFENPRWRYSREVDPIVGVSFTGLFDFFVNLFGRDWLLWWEEGRTNLYAQKPITREQKSIIDKLGLYQEMMQTTFEGTDINEENVCFNQLVFFLVVEQYYLNSWRKTVKRKIYEYCRSHDLKIPNRYTTVQPSGSKSLLSNASPGWHPPKATRYIRRVTFRREDPVALALLDYGYSVIPSQSDKDENGNLLNDPFDPRCTEWLVEIPVQVDWAEQAEGIDISRFSAIAQFDFYMQVQKYYTTHNTSATIEFREHEIESLGTAIYNAILNNEGYISAALLARFDANETFPRLPFEPINKERYQRLTASVKSRRMIDDFYTSLNQHAVGRLGEVSPSGCDSDKCLISS